MRKKKVPAEPETRPGKQLEALLEGLETEEQPAEKPRIGHMKGSFVGVAAVAIYVVGCIDLCAFLVGVTAVGQAFGAETWVQIGAQIFVGILSLLLIKYMDVDYQIGLSFKGSAFGLLALIPLAITIMARLRPLNLTADFSAPVVAGLSALTAAIWEEAYFRGFGVFLFAKKDGRVTMPSAIFLSTLFGLSQLTDILLNPEGWADYLLRAVFTTALGIFLLALYLFTKSLLMPIIIHFIFNLADIIFLTYSDAPLVLGDAGSHVMLATAVIVMLVCAVGLFRLTAEKRKTAPEN